MKKIDAKIAELEEEEKQNEAKGKVAKVEAITSNKEISKKEEKTVSSPVVSTKTEIKEPSMKDEKEKNISENLVLEDEDDDEFFDDFFDN